MVPDSGAPASPARLRPLNLPRPINIITMDDHDPPLPYAVIEQNHQRRVEQILDTWDVDEEWWRDPLRRRYYLLLLTDGSVYTVYQNRVNGEWFQQHY